jgi:anti-anti-sigma factor
MSRYPRIWGEVRSLPDIACVASFWGELDAFAAPVMAEALTLHTTPRQHVVLDLTGVTLMSAAAVTVVLGAGRRVTAHGRRLVLVADGAAARTVRLVGGLPEVSVTATTAEALETIGLPQDVALPVPQRVDIRGMRARIHIAAALRLLRERYALTDTTAAFGLLREASQRFNVPIRILAGAVLDSRRPTGPTWFPGQRAEAEPELPFPALDTPGATLGRALDTALDLTGARLGSAQSLDPFHGGLHLDRQRGFDPDFTYHYATVASGTVCTHAYETRQQTVVADLRSDPRLADSPQTPLLEVGVRAVQSTPLLTEDGDCVGVLSTHHPDALALPGTDMLARLTDIGAEVGQWLAWYRRTVVRGALEHVHQQARTSVGPALAERARRYGVTGSAGPQSRATPRSGGRGPR